MGVPEPDPISYRRQLEAVQAALSSVANETGIWGIWCCGPPSADSLLYEVVAANEKREIRLSWAPAGICVAFWETDAYSESEILYYPTYEAAIAAAREWLKSGAVLHPKVSWWRRLFG